jgi:hypothetical protein
MKGCDHNSGVETTEMEIVTAGFLDGVLSFFELHGSNLSKD